MSSEDDLTPTRSQIPQTELMVFPPEMANDRECNFCLVSNTRKLVWSSTNRSCYALDSYPCMDCCPTNSFTHPWQPPPQHHKYITHPLRASQGCPSTRRGCAVIDATPPSWPAMTLARKVPALAPYGACHPSEMKPRLGGVVAPPLSLVFCRRKGTRPIKYANLLDAPYRCYSLWDVTYFMVRPPDKTSLPLRHHSPATVEGWNLSSRRQPNRLRRQRQTRVPCGRSAHPPSIRWPDRTRSPACIIISIPACEERTRKSTEQTPVACSYLSRSIGT